MKKSNNNITKISAAVVALVAVVGLSAATFAQNADTSNSSEKQGRFEKFRLTEEEREEKRAEREESREAIDAAMAEGYDTWAAEVVEQRGEDAPMLDQVTEENFSALVQAHAYMNDAHELMEKADTVLEEVGIERPGQGRKFGKGGKHGGMRGMRGSNQ